MTTLYAGQDVALLTRHGKEALIRPALEPALACRIVHTDAYDTDQLGSFSGDVARLDSQLETAKKKARIGMQLTGAALGLASEGAFVPDPFGGLMPWNAEIVVWLDDLRGLQVVGMAQGPARSMQRSVRWLPELEKFAIEAGFPEHQLLLRPQSENDPRIRKGLKNWQALRQAFRACQIEASNQLVVAEHDLRAFCNPTRQAMIRKASEDLLAKLRSCCPQCSMPGYAITSHRPGLPCRLCGQPTRLALSRSWQCTPCGHHHEERVQTAFADPARCDACNP